MAGIPAAASNPVVEFSKVLESGGYKKYYEEEVNKAKSTLADAMARLYPDGVRGPDRDAATWNDQDLRNLAQQASVPDATGKMAYVSEDIRKAAKTVLDNGGSSSINPDGGSSFSEDDLCRSINK